MTLRELWWAASRRQEAEWERTAGLMAWVYRLTTGKDIDPGKLNPCRPHRQPARRRLPTEAESGAAWRVLNTYFRQRA